MAKESPYRHSSPKLNGGPGPYKGLHTQRMPGTDRAGPGRSPLVRKSIEHTFGSKNLPSDEIGRVVSNQWMLEETLLQQRKNEELMKQREAKPKGLKSKPTVTSLLRREANR